MSGSDYEFDDMPWLVRDGEAADLVAAFTRATEVERQIRRQLAHIGGDTVKLLPVATLDEEGRPIIRISGSIRV